MEKFFNMMSNSLKIPVNELMGFERINKAKNYRNWIYDTIFSYIGNRVLELGCGIGNMTQHFLNKELIMATDINNEYLNIVRKRYTSFTNLEVGLLDLTQINSSLFKEYNFDTIVCLNVLEHIRDDIKVLTVLREILCDIGTIIIFVPAIKCIYGAHDRDAGHYRRYNKQELINKMKFAGFTIKECFYFNFIGFWGWLISNKILNNNMYSNRELTLFEHVVPVISKLEKRIPIPFGLSLFAFGEKFESV